MGVRLRREDVFSIASDVLRQEGLGSDSYAGIEDIVDASGVVEKDKNQFLRVRDELYGDAPTNTGREHGILFDYGYAEAAEVFRGELRRMTGHPYIYHQTEMLSRSSDLLSDLPVSSAEDAGNRAVMFTTVHTHDTVEETSDRLYKEWKQDNTDVEGTKRAYLRTQEMNLFYRRGLEFIDKVTDLDSGLSEKYMQRLWKHVTLATGKLTRGRRSRDRRADFATNVLQFEQQRQDAGMTSTLYDTFQAYCVKAADRAHNIRHVFTDPDYMLKTRSNFVGSPDELRRSAKLISPDYLDEALDKLRKADQGPRSKYRRKSVKYLLQGQRVQRVFEREGLGIRDKANRLDDLQWSFILGDRMLSRIKRTAQLPEHQRSDITPWMMEATYRLAFHMLADNLFVAGQEEKHHKVYNPISLRSAKQIRDRVDEYMCTPHSRRFTTPLDREQLPARLRDIDLFTRRAERFAAGDPDVQELVQEMPFVYQTIYLVRQLSERSVVENAPPIDDYRGLSVIEGDLESVVSAGR